MTLTRSDFVTCLFNEIGLNKQEGKEFVDLFFEQIKSTLEAGESLNVSGFGRFDLKDKRGRPGRNPKTGESVPVSARRVVTFHACARLKERVAVRSCPKEKLQFRQKS